MPRVARIAVLFALAVPPLAPAAAQSVPNLTGTILADRANAVQGQDLKQTVVFAKQ